MSETESKDDFVVEEATSTVPGAVANMDDELKDYSEGVQKRINEFTAENARLKRELAAAQEFGQKAAGIAKKAVDEVQSLRARGADSEAAAISNLVSSLDAELGVAKAELKAAHEAADTDKIVEATARVSSLAADLRRAQVAKVGHDHDREAAAAAAKTRPPASPPQPPRQINILPKAQAWMDRNADWFKKDAAKTRLAVAADAIVAADGRFDPNSDAYYEEVDRVMNSRLNGGTSGGTERDHKPQGQGINPSGRNAPAAPGARKVTLTRSEIETAKRLGVTVEDYARSKMSGGIG